MLTFSLSFLLSELFKSCVFHLHNPIISIELHFTNGAETGQRRGRDGAETGQRRGRDGAETGQRRGRDGAETGQRRGRDGAETGLVPPVPLTPHLWLL